MKKTEATELFAIVPQALIADPNIIPTDKIIYSYLLGKYQTKRENGEPWTFSCPSIAKGTGLDDRNVRRRVKIIRKHGVLKLHGSLMNGKKRYDVFVFVPKALDTLISTADKMSVVIPHSDKGLMPVAETTTDISADNLSAQMSAKKKIVEERCKKEDEYNNNKAPALLTSAVPEVDLSFGEWCVLQGLHLTLLNATEKENALRRYELYCPSRATATRDANQAQDLAEQFEKVFYSQ